MNDFIIKDIERKVKRELLADDYTVDIQTEIITSDSQEITLNGDFVYLINDILDLPATAMLTLASSDNLVTLSKSGYESNKKKYALQSFREYVKVTVDNYEATLNEFELTFLKITPTFKK